MANLIDDLGLQYVNEGLVGALLFHNNIPHQIQEVGRTAISTIRFSGSMAKPIQNSGVALPTNLLDKGFEALSHPDLGYRTAANGRVLIELRQHQSFKRGLQLGELMVNIPPVSKYIAERFSIDLKYYSRPDVRAVGVVEDCFLPLAKGLEMVKQGEIFLFAVNSRLAVIPSSRSKEYLEIVYDGRAVGNISDKGVITGRITNASKLMEKLNGK